MKTSGSLARAALVALGRAAAVWAAALAANGLFLAWLAPGIRAGGGAPGALVVIVLGACFPVAWILLGQRYGLRCGLRYLYGRHREVVVAFLARRLRSAAARLGERGAPALEVCEGLVKVQTLTSDPPGLVLLVLGQAWKQRRMEDLIETTLAERLRGDRELPPPDRLAGALDAYLHEVVLDAGGQALWILAGMNALTAAGAWFWLR